MATLGAASAAQYRYYRFNTIATRSDGQLVQMSEFKFFVAGGARVSPVLPPTGDGSVTNGLGADFSPEGETPPNLIDNNNSKWLHWGDGGPDRSVIFDFGTAALPVIESYTYVTAQGGGGESDRNPKTWTLEGSSDGTTWDLLDTRSLSVSAVPTTQYTELPAFVIPASIPPVINSFTAPVRIVLNGATTDLSWDTTLADTVTISPGGAPDLPVDHTYTYTPPFAAGQVTDTVVTLTADSSTAEPVTSQLTVRSVPGGAITARFIRFTPLMTPDGNVQLADIRFYHPDEFGDVVEALPYPSSCAYTDGSGTTGGEDPIKLIDGSAGTKWYSGSLQPVVFTFETPVTFSSYNFTLGGDAGGYPGRNPRKWKLEASNDGSRWDVVDDVSAFEYPMPAVDNAIVSFPMPGYRIQSPPDIFGFKAKRDTTLEGDPIIFTWNSAGGDTVSITPGVGTDLEASGTIEFIPTADAVYTLTVTNTAGSKTKTLSFGAVDPAPTTINYEDFSSAGDEIVKIGDATLINDSYTIGAPGDVVRLRLTPDENGKNGAAWFNQRITVGGGFETEFDFQLTCASTIFGAEGLGFVIQNTAEGTASNPGHNGPAADAFTIKFSSWDNNAPQPWEARLNLLAGATELLSVDLFPLIDVRSEPYSLTGELNDTPYAVRIAYVPGDLDIWVDGVQVVTDFNVDLGAINAVDGSGTAYLGFVAATGGLKQASDVTSWTVVSSAVTTPLKLLASSVNAQAGTAAFTWASVPGKEYRITTSTNLTDWSQVVEQDIPATTAVTEESITFTPGTKAFFRIEEEP